MINYIFQTVSFLLLIKSSIAKTSKNSMVMQALSCAVTGIASFIAGAITGGATGIIGFFRTMVFKESARFSKAQHIGCLIGFQIINVAITIITYSSWISLLAAFNTFLRTYCLWTNNLKLIKWSAIEMCILLGIYYYFYDAYIMSFGYVAVFIITIISIMADSKKEAKIIEQQEI